jgi:bud site selection protein 20
VHKRRLKDLKEGAYTVEESQRAAGISAPDNRQRGVEEVVRRFGEAGVGSNDKVFVHSAPAPKAAA